MKTKVLDGPAALEELVSTHKLLDWQARKVLATARQFGLNNFPVNGGHDVMGVKYIDGLFHLGDADFSGAKR